MTQKILQYIEIDVDYCSLTYSVAPCQATLVNSPPTGTIKCFNTLNTCQDRANFTNSPVTLRFAVPTNYLPQDIECIPSIRDIQFEPAQISLGQNLGQRASLSISFDDHRHSDTGAGFDKYLSDRPYNPYTQGTFWGKFRARQPFVRGRSLRWIVGTTDQALAAMETRHFIIDSFAGPDNNGTFKIIAKDLLKLADGDRALAPAVSEGYLVADINSSVTSLTLTPSGAGAAYPPTGYVAIGGSEICAFAHQAAEGTDTDAFTKLLLHFDGPDGLAAAIDTSPANHGAGSVFGNAQLDETIVKFGSAAMLFDGSGDYVTFPNSSDWEFGTGDFTIEWWEYRVNAAANLPSIVRDAVTNYEGFLLGYSDGTNLTAYMTSTAGVWNIANAVNMGAISLNTWTHWAVTRSGNTFRSFKNGTQTNTWSSSASLLASSSPLSIGNYNNGAGFFHGLMDEIRISKGTARYTANFTPQTAPFPSGSTTSSDVLTILRAQLNTAATSHSAQDRVQMVLRYVSLPPNEIIADLFETYAGVDPSYIPANTWETEVTAHLNRLYSATIANPTSVNTLVSELIEQAGLAMWWDDRNQQIGMQVLRALVYNFLFDENNTVLNTIDISDQPDKRLSQVHTYFGQINALTSLTDKANYRSASIIKDAQSEADYGSAAIKEIFSRWIPAFGRTVADRLGNILIARFKDAPRKIKFSVMRNSMSELTLAGGYKVSSWLLQDATGAQTEVNAQITRLRPNPDLIEVETEEVSVSVLDEDLTVRQIIFDSNTYNINLRTVHDQIYPDPTSGITVVATINLGVKIGSVSTASAAFDIGGWPAGVTIIVVLNGKIQGHGGDGNQGARSFATAGFPGGAAIHTGVAMKLMMTGSLWGGGGGGGGGVGGAGYGGGGAGLDPGLGHFDGTVASQPGTETAGGAPVPPAGGGTGGAGGGPGLPGDAGADFAGGAAGSSIDGVSNVTFGTWDGTTFTPGSLGGDLRGPMTN